MLFYSFLQLNNISSVHRHFSCFHLSDIVTSCYYMYIRDKFSFKHHVSFLLVVYLGIKLLVQVGILCVVFGSPPKCFPQWSRHVIFSTNYKGFLNFTLRYSHLPFPFFFSRLSTAVGVAEDFAGACICNSPFMSDADLLLMCLLSSCMSPKGLVTVSLASIGPLIPVLETNILYLVLNEVVVILELKVFFIYSY